MSIDIRIVDGSGADIDRSTIIGPVLFNHSMAHSSSEDEHRLACRVADKYGLTAVKHHWSPSSTFFTSWIHGFVDSIDTVKSVAIDIFGDIQVIEGGLVCGPVVMVHHGHSATPTTAEATFGFYKNVSAEDLKKLQHKRAKEALLSDSVVRIIE